MARNALTVLLAVGLSCAVCVTMIWIMRPQAGVAVVDLDEVARQLGQQESIQQELNLKTEQTKKKLAEIEKDAVAQLEEAKRSLGSSPTKQQTEQFLKMQRSAQAQFAQIQQKAELELKQHRQKLVNRFRDETRPIVADVARKLGFSTVMTRNDAVLFSYEQAVDITADVAKAMASHTQRNGTSSPVLARPEGNASKVQDSKIQPVAHQTAE